MDFIKDLRNIITSNFSILGIEWDDSLSDKALYIDYLDTINRYIHPKKYRIYYSKEFNESYRGCSSEQVTAIKDIEKRLTSGQTVHPYLSRNVEKGENNPDLLLKHRNIHHLHLGLIKPGELKACRSDYLLFVSVKDDSIYFLNIEKHPTGSDWVMGELFNIIDRNWPNDNLYLKLQGVTSSQSNFSTEKIYEANKKGFNIITSTSNGTAVIGPNGGTTTAGNTLGATIQANKLFKLLTLYENNLRKGLAYEPNYVLTCDGTCFYAENNENNEKITLFSL